MRSHKRLRALEPLGRRRLSSLVERVVQNECKWGLQWWLHRSSTRLASNPLPCLSYRCHRQAAWRKQGKSGLGQRNTCGTFVPHVPQWGNPCPWGSTIAPEIANHAPALHAQLRLLIPPILNPPKGGQLRLPAGIPPARSAAELMRNTARYSRLPPHLPPPTCSQRHPLPTCSLNLLTRAGCSDPEANTQYSPIDNVDGGGGRTVAASNQACADRCAATSGCAHWSRWDDGGCHLSSSESSRSNINGISSGSCTGQAPG